MAIKIENKLINNLQEQVQYLTNFHEVNQALASWGIRVIGRLDDASELPPEDTYDGSFGDAYAVGTEAPYSFYIWTRPGEWFNFGPISIVGPQGPKGDMPDFNSSETITILENEDGSLEANLSAELVQKIDRALLLPSTSSTSAQIPVIQPGNVLTYTPLSEVGNKVVKHTTTITKIDTANSTFITCKFPTYSYINSIYTQTQAINNISNSGIVGTITVNNYGISKLSTGTCFWGSYAQQDNILTIRISALHAAPGETAISQEFTLESPSISDVWRLIES